MNMIHLAKRSLLPAAILFALPGSRTLAQDAPKKEASPEIAESRVQEIAGWLPEQPAGIGRPITDRAYWSDRTLVEQAKKFVTRAEVLLGSSFPAWDDAVYLDFSKTGQRAAGEKMIGERREWLLPLVMAEAVENRERFLPLLNKVLQSYAEEPTWTLPAHDSHLSNFHRQQFDVDLGAASFGHEIAEALFLLGDKVNPPVRKQLETALRQRDFEPLLRSIKTGQGCYWLRGTNNWNAVCLAGVVGASLAVELDRAQRARFVAIGEQYSRNFVRGFRPGGYCEEGVGYWGYGFGHYIVLRQEVAEATGGKLDLFADPRAVDMALFGVRIQIGKNTVPYFEDCQFGTKPSADCLAYCNEVFHLGLHVPPYMEVRGGTLEETLTHPLALTGNVPDASQYHIDPPRSYFPGVGVLADRPQPGSSTVLGIAIKAGGNGNHSHNDVGSYDIAVGEQVVSGDPGGPHVYDSKTFGPQRFDRKLLNSFGHPVPVVAGQLQIEATKARPVVLSTSFTDERDEIEMDITSSYATPALKKLVRTMVYSRAGKGQVSITDDVTFSAASPFEDAVITDGDWKQLDDHTLLLTMNNASLRVTVKAPGGFSVKAEKIEEMGAPTFTRLGLELKQPIVTGKVQITFDPVD